MKTLMSCSEGVRFARALCGWLAVFSICISSASAVDLYFLTSGTGSVLVDQLPGGPFTPWQVRDLQTTLGLFSFLTGCLWLALWMTTEQDARP